MNNLIEIPLQTPGKVFRSPMPFGRYDTEKSVFAAYQLNKISTVVMLVSEKEALEKCGCKLKKFYLDNKIEVIYLPIADFSVPDIASLGQSIEAVFSKISIGENVAVHCNAGLGRTGMFLGCLAKMALGLNGGEAIQFIRGFVPEAIETAEQEAVVLDYTTKGL